MNIPVAAIEAAAVAMDRIVPNSGGVLWEFTHDDGQKQEVTLTEAARAAIEAAMPAIREHIAHEVEVNSNTQYQYGPGANHYRRAIGDAARIVRGSE